MKSAKQRPSRARRRGAAVVMALMLVACASPDPNATTGPDAGEPLVEKGLFDNTGAKKLAVIMVNFADATNPESPEDALEAVFTGVDSVNAFYQNLSYGKLSLIGHLDRDGDVFGPVTLPVPSFPCQWEQWGPMARDMAASQGFIAANYDFAFYIFAGECTGYSRQHWSPPSMVLGGLSFGGLMHEGGHAFGWNHADSYLCKTGDQPVTLSTTDCRVVEYGDVFSLMGGTTMGTASVLPVNSFMRGQFGWLAPSNTVTMTRDGSATVARIERPTAAAQVVRIPRIQADGAIEQYLYIESRAEVPQGVLLRLATPYNMKTRSLLLDMTPDTDTVADAALTAGMLFEDPATGMSAQLLDVDSDGTATVQVTVGQPLSCTHVAPTGMFMPAPNRGAAGETTTMRFTLTNNNVDCASSLLIGRMNLPDGWPQPAKRPDKPAPPEDLRLEATLFPGASATLAFAVTPPAGTAPGIYPVSATMYADSGSQVVISGTFTVVP